VEDRYRWKRTDTGGRPIKAEDIHTREEGKEVDGEVK
jgi:hypothetical protein